MSDTNLIMGTITGGFSIIFAVMAIIWYKIEKGDARTDRLYEMFIEIVKEKK